MISQRTQEIINAFAKYIKDGDKSKISHIGYDELSLAVDELGQFKNDRYYEPLKRRLDELKDERGSKRTSKSRWIDRGIGIIIGICVALISRWLADLLGLK